MSTANEAYELARRRVIAKTVYKWVMAILVLLAVVQIAIWYLTTPDGYFWPVWPILAGVVIAVAWGIPTYSRRPAVSERRIQAELGRMHSAGSSDVR